MKTISKVRLQMIKENTIDYNEKITEPGDILRFLDSKECYNMRSEETVVLIILNAKNEVIAYSEISRGGVNFSYLDIPTIFKYIFVCNGSRFILCHNHPSGDAKPSSIDLQMTDRIKEASKIMQLDFLDHIVIGDDDYYSIL